MGFDWGKHFPLESHPSPQRREGFCRLLQIFADFCRFLQTFADFCTDGQFLLRVTGSLQTRGVLAAWHSMAVAAHLVW